MHAIAPAKQMMELWTKADYGRNALREWALANRAHSATLAATTADDAVAYVRLVTRWKDYVSAVNALLPQQAYWLLKRVP